MTKSGQYLLLMLSLCFICERGREGGRIEGGEGGREDYIERVREGGRIEGAREGEREGGEDYMEGVREGEREGGRIIHFCT